LISIVVVISIELFDQFWHKGHELAQLAGTADFDQVVLVLHALFHLLEHALPALLEVLDDETGYRVLAHLPGFGGGYALLAFFRPNCGAL
jgi:hypothetical protein